jgi:hypothetical protein
MAKGGRRYPLIVYREMLNRWWPETFWLGAGMFGLAWLARWLDHDPLNAWRWQWLMRLSVAPFLAALALFVMRSVAYIQPYQTYIRIVTPFLRFNISYKRLRKYTTSEFRSIFPPSKRMPGWKREVVGKFSSRTAVVLELSGWPLKPWMLKIFLSSLFFRDTTPHFVILVDDWMRLSLEIDSMRTGGGTQQQNRPQNQSILSRLPRNDK